MMKPTLEFRWALIPLGALGWSNPSALTHRGQYAQILQQKWVDEEGESIFPEEWRDIPMAETKS